MPSLAALSQNARRPRRGGIAWLVLLLLWVGFATAIVPPGALADDGENAPALPPLGGATPTPVGSFEGTLSVDASGHASYVMPLDLPLGTGEATPSVSLVYNSGAENGFLGVGWNVQASSAITDCHHPTIHHGEASPKCLDDMPLIRLPDAQQTDDRKVLYRTSPDTQLRVERWLASRRAEILEWEYGFTTIDGNMERTQWVVKRPDGWRYFYTGDGSGFGSMNSWKADDSLWLLWLAVDPSGNFIRYDYVPSDLDDGDLRRPMALSSIRYGGVNWMGGSNPHDKIHFVYKTGRTDPVYDSKNRYKLARLLERIDISPNDERYFRRYKFRYREPDGLGLSLLHSVEECAVSRGLEICKPATIFDYQTPTPGFGLPIELGTHADSVPCHGPFALQLTPDARDDLLWADECDDTSFLRALSSHAGHIEGLVPGAHYQHDEVWSSPKRPWVPATVQNSVEAGGVYFDSPSDTSDPKLHSVFNYSPTGGYLDSRDYSVPADVGQTLAYATIDINKDGLTDLVTCNDPQNAGNSTGFVWFWRARGQGIFSQPQPVLTLLHGNRLVCGQGPIISDNRTVRFEYGTVVAADTTIPPPQGDLQLHSAIVYYTSETDTVHGRSDTAAQTARPDSFPIMTNPDGVVRFASGTPGQGTGPTYHVRIDIPGITPFTNYHFDEIEYRAEFLQARPIDYNGDGYDDVLFPKLSIVTGGAWCGSCSQGHPDPVNDTQWRGDWHVAVWNPVLEEFEVQNLSIPAWAEWEHHGIDSPDSKYVFQPAVVGDFDGDGRTDFLVSINNRWRLFPRKESSYQGGTANSGDYLLRSIRTGTDRRQSIEYRRMNDIAAPYVDPDVGIYVPENWGFASKKPAAHPNVGCDDGHSNPMRCVLDGRSLVSRIQEHEASDGPSKTMDYVYEDARIDSWSGDWIGFARVTETTDAGQGSFVTRHMFFDNVSNTYGWPATPVGGRPDKGFPWATRPYRETTFLHDGGGTKDIAIDIQMQWELIPTASDGEQLVLSSTTRQHYEATHGTFSGGGYHPDQLVPLSPIAVHTTEATAFDPYGNPLGHISTAGDEQEEIHRTFDIDEVFWLLRRVSSTTEVLSDGRERTHEYEYYASSYATPGNSPWVGTHLEQAVRQPSGALSEELTTHYEYDLFGNVETITQSDSFFIPDLRTTTIQYLPGTSLPTKIVNPEGHTTEVWWDHVLGRASAIRDPFGVVQTATYDAFGRIIAAHTVSRSEKSTIAHEEYAYEAADGAWPAASRVQTRATNSAGAQSITLFGERGRPIQRTWDTFTAPGSAKQDRLYDALGRLRFESIPAFVNAPTTDGTTYSYDLLGRITQQELPDGTGHTLVHDGRTTRIYDAEGKPPWEVEYDVRGQIKTVTDALGTSFCYSYDGNGLLVELRKACQGGGGTELVTQHHDVLGRRTWLLDPARGDWSWEHDAFDQIRRVVDGEGQTTDYTYDRIGRVRTEVSLDGSRTLSYDELPPGWEPPPGWTGGHDVAGKLVSVEFDSATNDTYGRNYRYDDLGRVSEVQVGMPFRTLGGTIGTHWFASYHEYDQHGRLSILRYPETGDGEPGLIVRHSYAPTGELHRVAGDGQVLWDLVATDAAGRIVNERHGNGLVTHRAFTVTGRPTRIQTGALAQGQWSNLLLDFEYKYTPNGNLEWRTDHAQGATEFFQYDDLDRLVTVTTDASTLPPGVVPTWELDEFGNMIFHSEVGEIPAEPNGRMISAGGEPASYDENGNLISLGVGMSIDWWASGQPARIESEGVETFLDYGALGELAHREDVGWGSLKETWPVDGLLRIEDELLATRVVHSPVYVHGRVVATRVDAEGDPAAGLEFQYSHDDHLGSQNAVSDDWGSAVPDAFRSFGPWGELRPLQWANPGAVPGTGGPDVGYTGHRFLQDGGLTDMGARHYDPVRRRFASPDPVVAGVYDTQAWNSYTYVRSNPTTLIDPTGMYPCDIGMCPGAAGAVLVPGMAGIVTWLFQRLNHGSPREASSAGTADPYGHHSGGTRKQFPRRQPSGRWGTAHRATSSGDRIACFATNGGPSVILHPYEDRSVYPDPYSAFVSSLRSPGVSRGAAAGDECVGVACAWAEGYTDMVKPPDPYTDARLEAEVVEGRDRSPGGRFAYAGATLLEGASWVSGAGAVYGLSKLALRKGVPWLVARFAARAGPKSAGAMARAANVADDVFASPGFLKDLEPSDVSGMIRNAEKAGWVKGSLGRGSKKGQGLVLREVKNGKATGRMIQWHPGGGHHGPSPYWKVSGPEFGTVRIGPQFPDWALQ